MKFFSIKYTEEITKELFDKLIQALLSMGYIKGANYCGGDWDYKAFQKGGWLRTNNFSAEQLVLDINSNGITYEKTIWDFIPRESVENDFKPGDWVWNSEDGVLQVEAVDKTNQSFSAVGRKDGRFYYTLHTKAQALGYYSRHARPDEIPVEKKVKSENMSTELKYLEGGYVELLMDVNNEKKGSICKIISYQPSVHIVTLEGSFESHFLAYTEGYSSRKECKWIGMKPVKEEEQFKVGDYVEITKSSINWASQMDQFVGKIVKLVDTNCTGGFLIEEDGKSWNWHYRDGHFKRAKFSRYDLLEEARIKFPKGTRYKFGGTEYVVEDPQDFAFYDSKSIRGERFKGLLYKKGVWSEIVTLHSLLKEASLKYPYGVAFNNGSLWGCSMGTHTSSGTFKQDKDEILVKDIGGHWYTLYKNGKWAQIVEKKEKEEVCSLERLFPVDRSACEPEPPLNGVERFPEEVRMKKKVARKRQLL